MDKLECMRFAGKVNQEAIEAGFSIALPGYSLLEIEKTIEDLLMLHGCRPAFKNYKPSGAESPFPGSVCLSVNDGVVHGIPNSYVLKSGDLLTIDLGTEFNGWFVDAARSRIVPGADTIKSKPVENLIYATECIINAQLSIIKHGCTLMDCVMLAEETANKYGVNIAHAWGGHGIGSSIHMDPFIPSALNKKASQIVQQLEINRYKRTTFIAGNCYCVEPVVMAGDIETYIREDKWSVYTKDGGLACHSERCFVVLENGIEILT